MVRKAFPYLVLITLLWIPVLASAADGDGDKKDSGPKDTLTFVNGDRLTGSLVRTDGKNVTFKSDFAGEITVGWDKVKEIKTAGQFAVLEKGFKQKSSRKLNDARIPQGTLSVEDQTIAVQQGTGEPVSVPVAQTDFVVDQKTYEQQVRGRPEFYKGWSGAIQAGASLARSTSDTTAYNAGFNLVRVVPTLSWLDPRTRTTFNFADSFSKTTQTGVGTTETSILHADAEHDIYFSPRFYVLGNTQFDHNFAQGLDLQQIYGGGIGATFLKSDKQQLDVKAQAQYERQSYGIVPGTTGPALPDTNLIGATVAENYMRKLPHKIVFTEQLQAIPAFNVTSDYSGVAQAGLALPLFKQFNFTIQVVDNYLNDPAPGATKNSFQAITALQYTLK